jgi:hypothetical protein
MAVSYNGGSTRSLPPPIELNFATRIVRRKSFSNCSLTYSIQVAHLNEAERHLGEERQAERLPSVTSLQFRHLKHVLAERIGTGLRIADCFLPPTVIRCSASHPGQGYRLRIKPPYCVPATITLWHHTLPSFVGAAIFAKPFANFWQKVAEFNRFIPDYADNVDVKNPTSPYENGLIWIFPYHLL